MSQLIKKQERWRSKNPNYYTNWRIKNKQKIMDYLLKNKERISQKQKVWRVKNRERLSEKTREWRQRNPDYYKKYREKNNEKLSNYRRMKYREYFLLNPEKYREYSRMSNKRKRLRVLSLINPILECERCGCNNLNFLEINHKNGGGSKEFRRLYKNRQRQFYREIIAKKKKNRRPRTSLSSL